MRLLYGHPFQGSGCWLFLATRWRRRSGPAGRRAPCLVSESCRRSRLSWRLVLRARLRRIMRSAWSAALRKLGMMRPLRCRDFGQLDQVAADGCRIDAQAMIAPQPQGELAVAGARQVQGDELGPVARQLAGTVSAPTGDGPMRAHGVQDAGSIMRRHICGVQSAHTAACRAVSSELASPTQHGIRENLWTPFSEHMLAARFSRNRGHIRRLVNRRQAE